MSFNKKPQIIRPNTQNQVSFDYQVSFSRQSQNKHSSNKHIRDNNKPNNLFLHDILSKQNLTSSQKENLTSSEKEKQLLQKIASLQSLYSKQKQKTQLLQKRNKQLMNMLVSASQAGVQRNQKFIQEVERKICNFKAVNDLSSSQPNRSKYNSKQQNNKKRLNTQAMQDYLKTRTTRQSSNLGKFASNTLTQNNESYWKQNSNSLNNGNQSTRLKTYSSKSELFKNSQQDNKYITTDMKHRKSSKHISPYKMAQQMKILRKIDKKMIR